MSDAEGLTRDGVFHDVGFRVHIGEVAGLVGADGTEAERITGQPGVRMTGPAQHVRTSVVIERNVTGFSD